MSDPRPVSPEVSAPRVHFSGEALDKLREMLEEEDLLEEGGVRLSARHGAGCSAPLQFGMILEVAPESDDLVLVAGDVRLFMDPEETWSLDGLRVDYVSTPMGEGFAFRHPRGAGGRAC